MFNFRASRKSPAFWVNKRKSTLSILNTYMTRVRSGELSYNCHTSSTYIVKQLLWNIVYIFIYIIYRYDAQMRRNLTGIGATIIYTNIYIYTHINSFHSLSCDATWYCTACEYIIMSFSYQLRIFISTIILDTYISNSESNPYSFAWTSHFCTVYLHNKKYNY